MWLQKKEIGIEPGDVRPLHTAPLWSDGLMDYLHSWGWRHADKVRLLLLQHSMEPQLHGDTLWGSSHLDNRFECLECINQEFLPQLWLSETICMPPMLLGSVSAAQPVQLVASESEYDWSGFSLKPMYLLVPTAVVLPSSKPFNL
jgi:hypothetical protein